MRKFQDYINASIKFGLNKKRQPTFGGAFHALEVSPLTFGIAVPLLQVDGAPPPLGISSVRFGLRRPINIEILSLIKIRGCFF